MAEAVTTRRRVWVSVIGALGRDHVFWPVVATGLVFGTGPARWPSPLLWLVALVIAGPLLSFLLRRRCQRLTAQRTGG
jgi:hypothetical protein